MKLIYLKSGLKCHSFDVTIGVKITVFRVSVTIEPGRSLHVTTNCLMTVKVKYLCLTPVLNSLLTYLFGSVISFPPLLALSLIFTCQLRQILNWLVWLLFVILLKKPAIPKESLLVVDYCSTVFGCRLLYYGTYSVVTCLLVNAVGGR